MRALLQRVSSAAVDVGAERVGEIGQGLLVLLGVFPDDTEADAERLADRTLGLRIFPDEHKPMNRSVIDVLGGVLVVSQFTLAADTRKGRRPGFSGAAPPAQAEALYEAYLAALRKQAPSLRIESGRFGADMAVSLVNDGPVTLLLEQPMP